MQLQSMQKAATSADGDQQMPTTPPQRLDQNQQRQYQSPQQPQYHQRQQFQGPGYGSSQDATKPALPAPQREQPSQQMHRPQYNNISQFPEYVNQRPQPGPQTRPYVQRLSSQTSSGSSGGF
jgi:hypothetical protein